MKRGTPDHPKILMLAAELRRLGVAMPRIVAVGILESLWHWTARYAIQGDIGRWPDEIIEAALEWSGEPGALIRALVRSRWLDEVPEPHRLVIHDIQDHADNTWRQCLEAAGLTWWDGTPVRREKAGRPSAKTPAKLQENSNETPDAGISLELKLQQNSSETPVKLQENSTAVAVAGAVARAGARARARAGAGAGRMRTGTVELDGSGSDRAEPPAGSSPNPETAETAGSIRSEPLRQWHAAIEHALREAVGRPARNGTALKLLRAAAEHGIHPRYLVAWISERARASPPRSDGLFLRAVADLPGWVVRHHCHDPTFDRVEAVMCAQCGEGIYAFRDVVVPCGCNAS